MTHKISNRNEVNLIYLLQSKCHVTVTLREVIISPELDTRQDFE